MSAWADMQEDWTNNCEDKFMSGILLWDLSAAFDTLDPCILCEKLRLYKYLGTYVDCEINTTTTTISDTLQSIF